MPTKRELVYWQGNLIGYFEILNADMFNIYGKFSPANTPDGKNFLVASQDKSADIRLHISTAIFQFIEFWDDKPEIIELKFLSNVEQ
jgi:hypothetical protein